MPALRELQTSTHATQLEIHFGPARIASSRAINPHQYLAAANIQITHQTRIDAKSGKRTQKH